MVPESTRPERLAFVPTLLSNLVPLAGIAFLGWSARNVLFVYWIEVGVLVLLYSGLTLFAQREPRPDERTIHPVTLSVPFVNAPSGAIRPVDWLPPIHSRNLRYATGMFVWGLGFWACLSVLMVVLPSPRHVGYDSGMSELVAVVSAAYSPTVLLSVCALVVSRVVTVRREFFGRQTYERLSAPMTAEIPARQVVFWFLLTPVAQFVLPVVALPLVGVFDQRTLVEGGIALLVVAGKLFVEWSNFRAQELGETGGVAGWFTPEELDQ